MARDRYFESECIEIEPLCSNVRHIVFRRVDGEPLGYVPGQFVMIHFEDAAGVQLNRSYSMAAAAPEDGTFALCVKRVEGGLGSGLIHGLSVGDRITTSGPYGRFVLKQELPKDVVLVATGTGAAPFHAMVGQLEEAMATGTRVWLLLGVRFADEVLYDGEWRALAARQPAFRYLPTVSRTRPNDGWDGAWGYVRELLPEVLAAIDVNDTLTWLCGVPAMIDEVRTALAEAGVPARAIKTEKYVSPPPPKGAAERA